ncbi:metallophosphoesterase [Cryptosporangium minutisporangium]|uniref:Metallophosphoesterase n=1 Tax=Cryptosporangium minutisporangium TaxID=113569 RepID=A0ABP6T5Y0_9ACTN
MGIAQIVVMVIVVVGVLGGIHTYLWWRLVASPFPSRRARLIGAAVLVVIVGFAMFGLRGRPEALPGPLATVVSWGGPLWVAIMFYLLVILLVLEPVRVVGRILLARRARKAAVPVPVAAAASGPETTTDSQTTTGPETTTDSEAATAADPAGSPAHATTLTADSEPTGSAGGVDRRVFLARALALTAGVGALSTVGYGVTEARNVQVKRVPITLPRLDPALNGFRIALLTDIHISATLHRPFVERVVRSVNSLDVDAVAIVGDLVDGSVAELGEDAKALSDLRSAHGTYFVTGNHEYYSGAEEWVEYLPTIGVQVLRNRHIEIPGGAGLDLAGVDDVTAADSGVPGHGANLAAALDGRNRDRPVVLLAHQPVQWPEAVQRGVDLQLSGHTHGGQMWPFTYGVRLEQPVVAGRARDGDSQIYVSRGVGYWGPPVRVGAPPEISLIELRAL